MPGPIIDMPAADQNVDEHHQQKERIKPRETSPQIRADAFDARAGYQIRVIVVNDKTAEHKEQRHAKAGRLPYPVDGAVWRFVIGKERGTAVRDQYKEGSIETKTGERRNIRPIATTGMIGRCQLIRHFASFGFCRRSELVTLSMTCQTSGTSRPKRLRNALESSVV